MFESITANVLSTIAALPIGPAVDAVEIFVGDQRAFNYSKEHLRAEYAPKVQPASYDGVIENLRISRQDLIDYFRSASSPTKEGLDAHLMQRLIHRTANWTHNTLPPDELRTLLREFYEAYERYFFTVDPLLSNLAVMGLSSESRQLLTEIQSQIARLAQRLEPAPLSDSIFRDVELLLKVSGSPFDVIESGEGYRDIQVVEPQSIAAVTHVFCITSSIADKKDVDHFNERMKATRDGYAYLFLVSPADVPADIQSYSERRGIKCISIDEFRAMLSQTGTPPTLLVGRLAAAGLARALNIDKVFIPADAVPTQPGEEMEDRYYTERVSVDTIVDDFLSEENARLLIILGDYGSGKSVVAARTLTRFSDPDGTCCAAFVPLAQLDRAELVADATRRADNAMRALYPRTRQRLVILDGLDELKDAMAPTSRKNNMLRLLDASAKTDKLIVTARTSYFRGLEDFWNLFSREHDQRLWEKLAKHIPEGSARPRVRAAILREFDSEKILRYLTTLGEVQGRDPSWANDFLERVRQNDPDTVYQRLMRSPLYLFLIVNTAPWEDESVRCLADVVRLFIRYWLERDVSKGASRWLLTTDDRTAFVSALAWWMFQTRRSMLSYKDFDDFVARYFNVDKDSEDARALGLDLHTTGVFASVGRWLFFAMPAFGHYFVAMNLCQGFGDHDWPEHLPTVAEAKLWLGHVLTRRTNECFDFTTPPETAAQWQKNLGVADSDVALTYDLRGIVYGPDPERYLRSFNSSDRRVLRGVLEASLKSADVDLQNVEHVLAFAITNKLGLHARAAAKVVWWLRRVFGDGPPDTEEPDIWLAKGGEVVNARKIIELLLLAAGRGSSVEFRFKHYEPEKVMAFLKLMGATTVDGGARWTSLFDEFE